MDLHEATEAQIQDATRVCDEAAEAADSELEALAARADELAEALEAKGEATTLEWLQLRAAQADRDLADARHQVGLAAKALDLERLRVRLTEIDLRLGEVDYVAEWGAVAAGNDAQMGILMLDVQQASAGVTAALSDVDFARRRMDLTEQMYEAIHASLRAETDRVAKADG